MSEILHLFGQGNLPFIREKSGKSQGILKTDVCGNHVTLSLCLKFGTFLQWLNLIQAQGLSFQHSVPTDFWLSHFR